MTTIITIKKNKPAYRALILLAKELKKSDESSIIIEEEQGEETLYELTEPSITHEDTEFYLNQLTDFPSLQEIRKKAWPEI